MTRIEFAISAGAGGGGQVLLDNLTLRELPEVPRISGLKAIASSEDGPACAAQNAVDGNPSTRWASKPFDPQWLEIDMGCPRKIAGLELQWDGYGDYDILVSPDEKTWRTVYSRTEADGGQDDVYFEETTARFVKILGKRQATRDGYSLFEVGIKGPDEAVRLTASSAKRKNEAAKAMDGNMSTQWHSDGNGVEWLQVDLRGEKACGGLFIHWGDDYAKAYDVEASGNGLNWYPVYRASDQNGGIDKIFLEETEARFLRVVCRESGTGNGYSIRELVLKAADKPMTVTRFYQIAAGKHPGCYPRWLSNEQAYWTIVGTPEDVSEGVLCEDGTLEPHKRGFTIMPLLRVGGKLVTRNEALVSQSLRNDYLPIPSVEWAYGELRLTTELFAHGGDASSVYASYTIRNGGKDTASGQLFLTVRPMQVYPPWQGGTDGFSPIRSIAWSNGVVRLDSNRTVYLLTKPDVFAAKGGTFQIGRPVEGDIADDIAKGKLPASTEAADPAGFASGTAVYNFQLAPGESREIFVAVPLHDKPPELDPAMAPSVVKEAYAKMLAETAAYWTAAVNRVGIHVPDTNFVNTFKSYIAYNLITKDGPGFQPGSRSYDKAWMRDGGSAAEALLKVGFTNEIKDFVAWFGGYQFDSGEVPPIIDNKNADPLWEEKQQDLHEFDSQGEFVHLVLEYYRFTRDRPFLDETFPKVVKALKFLEALRAQRCTPEYKDGPPEKRIFYGILPGSRSHEGYWLAHSYWDDFWALRGWKDGKAVAEILGKNDLAAWMSTEYHALQQGVYESIALVTKLNKIDYIPGCAEKADFDATSTAEALVYCDELLNMPQPQLQHTFDRYYTDLSNRLKPGAQYVFTPYEMRSVLAFLFMGEKDRALTLLNFMLTCRRPAAWNHLAEVVHSDYRFPCYIGDMPHTWVGAEYINAARCLFLYEAGDSLVLGAGIDPKWLAGGEAVSIENFPSHFGRVSFEMRKQGDSVSVRVSGDAAPTRGFIFKSPLDAPAREIQLNGKGLGVGGREARFQQLPAEVVFLY